ncbi:hypothetical protein JD844_000489 [Phrynosoma platyrhinos]|uniref:M-phase phosphoprotein 6 n=1 Tax=Phrynosoma platyrhinos TaxID=52577 RepID=A0ABQ7SQS8_PHRPL|nr:hypothetical protein JD844_000489 [Phrynosoma platyrhinos]
MSMREINQCLVLKGLEERLRRMLESMRDMSFIIEERSFAPCEDLLYGRMSFKGFNPEVEKLMIQMNSKYKTEEIEEEDNAMEADVSDEEMARRYETLVGTIGKKFLKKRDRHMLQEPKEDENSDGRPSKAKKMFLKPQD